LTREQIIVCLLYIRGIEITEILGKCFTDVPKTAARLSEFLSLYVLGGGEVIVSLTGCYKWPTPHIHPHQISVISFFNPIIPLTLERMFTQDFGESLSLKLSSQSFLIVYLSKYVLWIYLVELTQVIESLPNVWGPGFNSQYYRRRKKERKNRINVFCWK
jgi:hypothetical protein